MNNLLRIMALNEDQVQRAVFVRAQNEAGINCVYDPGSETPAFQVFIHSTLPYKELSAWNFDTFNAARSFAAEQFKTEWELLVWDGIVKRPCADGGHECGSNKGGCSTCAPTDGSAAAGCTSCTIE